MNFRTLITALFLLPALLVQAQEISFQALVDRNEIATGEALKLTIELTNASSAGNINAPDLGGLAVLQGPMQSSNFSSINGRISRSSSISWYLTATRPGTYTIGAATVRVGGGVLQTEPLTIKVTQGASSSGTSAAAEQAQKRDPNLFCTITLNKNKAYVGEQIIATYTLYSRYNSLRSLESEMPKLNGFWAEDVELEGNWEPELRTVNGLRYRVATLKRQVLIPLHSGTLTLAPMTLSYLVNASIFNSGTTVTIQSGATEVNVKELPPGKPADFIGAVGDLQLEVKTANTEVKANEAIDLSIRFSGRANLKLVDAPTLNLPPGFDSYDPKIDDQITVNSSGMSGRREFQYLLIPRHEGTYDLGALSFSYFDPSSGTYKQLRSGEITFHVKPGDGGAATNGAPAKVDVQRLGSDIRYIRTGDLDLQPKGKHLFGSLAYVLGMIAPPLLLLLFFLWKRKRDAWAGDADLQRRHGADRAARKRLELASKALEKDDREAFHDALGKALEGYFADKFNLGVAEVNAAMIHHHLDAMDEGRTANELIAMIADAQMARFAPVEGKPRKQAYEEARAIIHRIETRHGK